MARRSAWSDLDDAAAARRPSRSPDICIIGAGAAGITVAKALHERGLDFDCFEKGSDLGGLWRYQNDNGLSSAYANLHINTSRHRLGYSDFPIPETLPDFLSHRQVLAYLESYADAFGIRPLINFRTTVDSVTKGSNGGWRVHLWGGGVRHYRAVIVASGHLWNPRLPAFPGLFFGDTTHSHHYRTAQPYVGKKVLVVGMGNSAIDIAVDLCRRAAGVTLSTRRGAWITPKYLMGKPTDEWAALLSGRMGLPGWLTRTALAPLIRLAAGDQRRFGLQRPAHPIWREHPTVSQELLPCLGHGLISVKPNVRLLDGTEVEFDDGSRQAFDSIVYATGYRTSFPFLAKPLFDPEADTGSLYRQMASPKHRGLMFAGLVEPVGPTMPVVEAQGRWLAAALAGDITLPDPETQVREAAARRKHQRATYLDSERYALAVDDHAYLRQLHDDMHHREGRRRHFGELATTAIATLNAWRLRSLSAR
ncbi:flavin-containing monooxygenase [Chelatococcus reniformis]|uniref:Trimethylamine monooxygenase n=1 Tax=Chelatococcus reniformis TaxID=1494448 RepID=A0A916UJW4_9HYPH|nr:NAD(P)-binding domain-containing protein [Chelatococcus reniformis]GGC74727.1 monooxygenase [Chelatococcus reniformis]